MNWGRQSNRLMNKDLLSQRLPVLQQSLTIS